MFETIPSLQTIVIYSLSFLSLFVQVFFLVTYIERRKDILIRRKDIVLKRYPSVSIIVPCYNEEKTLYKTVRSLLDLDYPKNKLTIILVDDGSIDGTWSIMQKFSKNSQIQVHRKVNGGKHTAMNWGIEHSDSELIGGLDADSFVDKEALKRIVTYFNDPTTMAVAPSILVYRPNNILQKAQKAEYDMAIYTKKMLGFLGGIHVTPGPFSIFRKKVFNEIGHYKKAHNTEDQEIALRMHEFGYKIEHCPDAYVYTVSPRSIKALYKQRLRWIYGFIKNTFDYRRLFFKKKYGNLGFFTLPAGAISIMSVIALASIWISYLVKFINKKVVMWETVGFESAISPRSFDWFFINTEGIVFMSFVLYSLIVMALILGRRMGAGKKGLSLDVFYFVAVYSVIAPAWILKAIWNAIMSKESNWIGERKPGRVI